MTPFLELIKISRFLGSRQILTHVDMALYPKQAHILIGENGAGKSTICKIIGGDMSFDAGELHLDGKARTFNGPREANFCGIRSIYQETQIFPQLTVAENIFFGRERTQAWLPMLINQQLMDDACASFFQTLGIKLNPKITMDRLGLGQLRVVEILRAAMMEPNLIVVDEATASLAEPDRQMIFGLLQALMERGVSILLVTHRLQDLAHFGDRVTVLKEGRVSASGPVGEIGIPEIVRLMARETALAHYPKLNCKTGRSLLQAKNLCRTPILEAIDFTLHCGEVLGLAGLLGSGRTALARTIAGVVRATDGEVLINGRRIRLREPSDAVQAGMCYVAEDSRRKGLFLSLNVPANITITDMDRVRGRFFLNPYREEILARGFIDELGIGLPDPYAPASRLSGGNQQKVALAKWLYRCAQIFVLDEPTRGLDVETKLDFYNIINELVRCGAGVILISSDLQELQGMSDRILVMYSGRIVGEMSKNQASEERILFLATGGTMAV